MSHTTVKNAKTDQLSEIFANALQRHVPGITADDIEVKALRLHDVPEIEIATAETNMRMLGLTEKINHHAQTNIDFPTIKDPKLVQAVQLAAKTLTGYWVSYSSQDISIKADLDTVAEILDNQAVLDDTIASFRRFVDAGLY